LARVFGLTARVADLPFADLRRVAPEVPRLREILALPRVHFMIELKERLEGDRLVSWQHELAAVVGRRSQGPLRAGADYHLLSLRSDLVVDSPSTPKESWILVGDVFLGEHLKRVTREGLGGVAGHYLPMTSSRIHQLHARGRKAGGGFVRTQAVYHRCWHMGLDWVFTNHAESVGAWAGEF
jgi:hypothetical protein